MKQVLGNRNTLSLEIRDGYINIYYRGGNLLRITQKKNGYSFHFDERYCLNKGDDSAYDILRSLDTNSAGAFEEHFPLVCHTYENGTRVSAQSCDLQHVHYRHRISGKI